MPAARELAKEFCNETSAVSVAMARQMMWKMLGADHPMEAHQIDSRGVYFTGKSEDAQEGVKSFLEKRPANYPGKVSSDMPEFFPWWEPRDFN
jgi:enoyl-CoA hydratase/carnithine racemase